MKTHHCKVCGRDLGPDDVSHETGEYHGGDTCPCGANGQLEPIIPPQVPDCYVPAPVPESIEKAPPTC